MRRLGRNQSAVSIGTSSTSVLGPNLNRVALLLHAPAKDVERPRRLPELSSVNDFDANQTATALSYTVPTGRTSVVISATLVVNSGTPTVQLQVNDGGTVVVIGEFTANARVETQISLQAGDIIRWEVTAAGGVGSTIDATISVVEEQAEVEHERVSYNLAGPAVDGEGFVLSAGNPPLLLTVDEFGWAIKEPVNGIMAVASESISIIETFEL